MFRELLTSGILAYNSTNLSIISREPDRHERVFEDFHCVFFLTFIVFLSAKGKEKNNEPKKTATKENTDEKEEK